MNISYNAIISDVATSNFVINVNKQQVQTGLVRVHLTSMTQQRIIQEQ